VAIFDKNYVEDHPKYTLTKFLSNDFRENLNIFFKIMSCVGGHLGSVIALIFFTYLPEGQI
jgi:hypothetical protein